MTIREEFINELQKMLEESMILGMDINDINENEDPRIDNLQYICNSFIENWAPKDDT